MGLLRIDDRPLPEGRGDSRAFLVVRDEINRLPSALDHHRNLGVDRFLVVDNASTDGTIEYLLAEPDVHVFQTSASYLGARLGIDWLEALLNLHGVGRWCLVLDADEHFVYPGCESLRLPEFCSALQAHGLDCLATIFIDVYSDRPIAETWLTRQGSPIDTCRFFDASGYYNFPREDSPLPCFYGGVRARLFWPEFDLSRVASDARSYVARAFDEGTYLHQNPDVAAALVNGTLQSALQHFLHHGRTEGRPVSVHRIADWPEAAYLAAHPEVKRAVAHASFSSGLEHYVRFGQFEGRLPHSLPRISQVPLLHWQGGMHLDPGRHDVWGTTWRRRDAVGGALLHFKLVGELAGRSEAVLKDPARPVEPVQGREGVSLWGSENERYSEVMRCNPQLCGMGPRTVRYRDSLQLVELGLVKILPEL